jgi:hypothetical protein
MISMNKFERSAWALLLVITPLLAGACADASKILEQEAPSRVDASTLDNPTYAQLLVNGAIGDFECALGNYVIAGGLVGDELIDAQLGQAGWDYDRRTIFTGSLPYSTAQCGANQTPGLYTPLSVARFQADATLRKLQGWTDEQVPKRDSLVATAATYAGYSLLLLGEAMCSAAIDQGPEMSRAELFTAAQDRFNTAITAAGGTNAKMLNAAHMGLARTLLNLGKVAEAGVEAAKVPVGFALKASYSSTSGRRENLVWTQMYRGFYSSVDPSYRNVTWLGVPDPRVKVVDGGINGHDKVTRIWRETKYASISDSIPIARYTEAQLIVAEADVAAGNTGGAVTIINQLHTNAGIPPYDGVNPPVQQQIIEERRRELFLEGQRLGDLIRYNLTATPVKGTPFKNGGFYGNDTGLQLCFPLPDIERNNNPNINGGG